MTKYIFLLILLIVGASAYTMTPKKEYIKIRNDSSKTLIITKEYRDDPSKIFYSAETQAWAQDVYGVNLSVHDRYLERSEVRILPKKDLTILNYYPWGPISLFTQMDQIPFMDKMRSIYKSLTIATEDGQKVITLENLGEHIKKEKSAWGITYTLVIRD
jgi:hypothetical protein